MKFEDLNLEEREISTDTGTEIKLFVDLDGVMADFDKKAEATFGELPSDHSDDEMWDNIRTYENKGKKWFIDLEKMSDADELWNYIKKYNPEILTATGTSIKDASEQKREWVKRNIPGSPVVNIVQKSREKKMYAAPNHVLIDDRKKSIEPWIAAGGIGILHTSARETIGRLKELGL